MDEDRELHTLRDRMEQSIVPLFIASFWIFVPEISPLYLLYAEPDAGARASVIGFPLWGYLTSYVWCTFVCKGQRERRHYVFYVTLCSVGLAILYHMLWRDCPAWTFC